MKKLIFLLDKIPIGMRLAFSAIAILLGVQTSKTLETQATANMLERINGATPLMDMAAQRSVVWIGVAIVIVAMASPELYKHYKKAKNL